MSLPTKQKRHDGSRSNFIQFGSDKIVYRRYAGLFFCMCIDARDNELAHLEAIHLFVEALDTYFNSVCELDLVFNFYHAYAILDELILAGEIGDASRAAVLARIAHLDSQG
ncbi:AP-2 complex subunit sigma [Malassezia cuniculi]|uniref:AP complex subunit sigma n=1 Tax=Malassezia cuniculi TaxID=948313 RepID=A0AAF0F1P6_9BASI|nr:AP-2 complex subunit sigma [Malassezia cuniculi]